MVYISGGQTFLYEGQILLECTYLYRHFVLISSFLTLVLNKTDRYLNLIQVFIQMTKKQADKKLKLEDSTWVMSRTTFLNRRVATR